MSKKRWLYPTEINQTKIQAMVTELGIHPITAAVLLQRGFDGESATQFWSPKNARLRDYKDLPGTILAGEMIARAIRQKDKVVIFGDYDVDGITASALLTEFIRFRQGQVEVMLPNRFEDGYGLSHKVIDAVIATGARWLVTVDCGITAVEEIKYAREKGLSVVITDHHEPGLELPVADAMVNPKVSGPDDLKLLAGVGVVLMVARAAAAALGENDHEPLRRHLDLVALGTVADVVPLLLENRFLTRAGLAVINRGMRLGLRALVTTAGLELGKITSTDLAFRLAPRINAPGRIGDARMSLDLLLTQEAEAAELLAIQLNQQNVKRQQSEQVVLAEAEAQLATWEKIPTVILLGSADWPVGVIGLAASRLCEKYHRPSFVLSYSKGIAKGSARSIPGFPLHQVLNRFSEFLKKWGGHSQAAGVTLSVEKVDAFYQALLRYSDTQLDPETMQPTLQIDALAELKALSPRLIKEFKRFEPFGFHNIRPLLVFDDLRLFMPPRVVGERHLKLKLMDRENGTIDAIGFGLGERAPELKQNQRLAVIGHVSENTWNNATHIQIEMKDFQI